MRGQLFVLFGAEGGLRETPDERHSPSADEKKRRKKRWGMRGRLIDLRGGHRPIQQLVFSALPTNAEGRSAMKVAELIETLRAFEPELRVAVPGPEGGCDDISPASIRQTSVQLFANREFETEGSHEEVPDDEPGGVPALIIDGADTAD